MVTLAKLYSGSIGSLARVVVASQAARLRPCLDALSMLVPVIQAERGHGPALVAVFESAGT